MNQSDVEALRRRLRERSASEAPEPPLLAALIWVGLVGLTLLVAFSY